jgi:WD40 repeat protein
MKLDELRQALDEEARRLPFPVDGSAGRLMRRAMRQRRHQRVRRSAAAAIVVALAAAAVGILARDRSDGQLVTTAASNDVVIAALTTRPVDGAVNQWASDVLYVDAATGSSHTRAVPSNNYGGYPVQLLQAGGRLLLPGGGVVRSAPLDLSSPPKDIATALVFVPSADRDRVWTVSEWQDGNRGPYTVTEVAADGSPTSKPIALPAEANWPIAGTDEGLLLRGALDSEDVLLWNPDTGQVARRIARVPWYQGNGWAFRKLFAWLGPCSSQPTCDRLHFIDLTTGVERTIEPPAEAAGFVPDGALSPDGNTLAMIAATQSGRHQLVLVDTSTGAARLVPGATRAGAGVAWSGDGTYVFFGEDDSTAIASYRLGDASSHRIRDHLSRFTAILAIDRHVGTRGAIQGTLTAVGGPVPGHPRPTAGVVTVQRDGEEAIRVDVPTGGAFRIDVPPGAYRLSASFGNDLSCGSAAASARPGRVSVVAFTCHMR